ncbi:MAG: hypothetical protein A3J27_06965 [Candidatus Tectomicrobia bacterium RIFCSPLOWO2_12_FULL_69_37]|nr:MAG: hypothetical protein A3I72_08845 [Candidatus Tectomicrobia bacterium RIFCSPLOWO2_02_FULL_70_19]OGL63148.1 MAG: hypothetical protein A3J27_06965 [Candidatus Tectomicrobia bacterium RIFCSPLOWO2_12_FULL_69_37]
MVLLRMLMRSSGLLAASLVLLAMAFYGIALLSVMVVDDPRRGLKVLGVFLLLSGFFSLLLRWVFRQALQQVLRPLGAAREATNRLASLGGRGGREAFRTLRGGASAAGWLAARAVGAVVRAAARAAALLPGSERAGRRPASGRPALVIPLRRGGQDRKAR